MNINNLTPSNNEPRGLDFGINGIKLIIANDFNQNGLDQLMEYDLVCPYNLFEGKCDAITEGDRTGMAEAQMELARRTIDHSTNSALNRLKWIRRNKDKQDLTNLQIDIDFSNLDYLTPQILSSTAVMTFIMMYADSFQTILTILVSIIALIFLVLDFRMELLM